MKNKYSAFYSIHPAAAFLYFAAEITLTMFSVNPMMLLFSFFGGVLFFAIVSGVRRLFSDLTFYIPMMLMTAIVNPLFSHNGVTPLFFMNGNAITLEAVLYGCNISLMLGAVVFWCKCLSCVVSSDKLLYLFGKTVPVSSLVVSMALRFIPLFKKKFWDIKESQISVGLYDNSGIVNKLSSDLKVFSALVGWTMESGVQTSESMKARGYGLRGRSSFSFFKFSMYDLIFCVVFLLSFLFVVLGIIFGNVKFEFYPRLSDIKFQMYEIVSYSAFFVMSLMPFVYELREALKWKYLLSKI